MASRSLDLLATQRDSSHDEGAADPNADAATSRRVRLVASRPELFLAFPDEVVQDAGVRWNHHRPNTIPSSDQRGHVRLSYRTSSSVRQNSYAVNSFEPRSLEPGRMALATMDV